MFVVNNSIVRNVSATKLEHLQGPSFRGLSSGSRRVIFSWKNDEKILLRWRAQIRNNILAHGPSVVALNHSLWSSASTFCLSCAYVATIFCLHTDGYRMLTSLRWKYYVDIFFPYDKRWKYSLVYQMTICNDRSIFFIDCDVKFDII